MDIGTQGVDSQVQHMSKKEDHHKKHCPDDASARQGAHSVHHLESWECFYYALLKIKEEMEEKELYSKYGQGFSNYALHSCLWNLESLPMDIAEKLYNKLINEWFDKLNINGHDDKYFKNKNG